MHMKSKFDIVYEAYMNRYSRGGASYFPYTVWKATKAVTNDFQDEWVNNRDAEAKGVEATGKKVLKAVKELAAIDHSTGVDADEKAACRTYLGYWKFINDKGGLTDFTRENYWTASSWGSVIYSGAYADRSHYSVRSDKVGAIAWGMWKAGHSAVARKAANIEQMASTDLPFKVGDQLTIKLKVDGWTDTFISFHDGNGGHSITVDKLRGTCADYPNLFFTVKAPTKMTRMWHENGVEKPEIPDWPAWRYDKVAEPNRGVFKGDVIQFTGKVQRITPATKNVYIAFVTDFKFVEYAKDPKEAEYLATKVNAAAEWRKRFSGIVRMQQKLTNKLSDAEIVQEVQSQLDDTNDFDAIKDEILALLEHKDYLVAIVNDDQSVTIPDDYDPWLLKYEKHQ